MQDGQNKETAIEKKEELLPVEINDLRTIEDMHRDREALELLVAQVRKLWAVGLTQIPSVTGDCNVLVNEDPSGISKIQLNLNAVRFNMRLEQPQQVGAVSPEDFIRKMLLGGGGGNFPTR